MKESGDGREEGEEGEEAVWEAGLEGQGEGEGLDLILIGTGAEAVLCQEAAEVLRQEDGLK